MPSTEGVLLQVGVTDAVDFLGVWSYLNFRARYPSGKGEVCKTFMRRFDSDPRLQRLLIPPL